MLLPQYGDKRFGFGDETGRQCLVGLGKECFEPASPQHRGLLLSGKIFLSSTFCDQRLHVRVILEEHLGPTAPGRDQPVERLLDLASIEDKRFCRRPRFEPERVLEDCLCALPYGRRVVQALFELTTGRDERRVLLEVSRGRV